MFFLSAFLFNASGYLLLPTLPIILHARGASPATVGLVMGSFTAAALLCRAPVSALLTRKPPLSVVRAGFVFLGVGFLAYWVLPGTAAFLSGRVVQGVGLAVFNTAAYVYLAEVAGPLRRAEFVSLFGLSANVAMGFAPAAGSLALAHLGESWLFGMGLLVAATGLLVVPRRSPPPPGGAVVSLWERQAWKPTAAMVGLSATYGTVMVFVPLAMAQAGIPRGWPFFSAYAAAIVATRLATRRRLDRGERLPWAFGGATLVAAALITLAFSRGTTGFLAAAVLFGMGVGIGHPSLMVYILESVPLERRSAAAAMGTSAFDIGNSGGAALAGWVASHWSYPQAFGASTFVFLLLLIPLAAAASRGRPPAARTG